MPKVSCITLKELIISELKGSVNLHFGSFSRTNLNTCTNCSQTLTTTAFWEQGDMSNATVRTQTLDTWFRSKLGPCNFPQVFPGGNFLRLA